jgi:hypothetical protein
MNQEWITAVKDWSRMRGRTWNSTQTVSVTTLDNIIREHGVPAFCKIDVEGYELRVLQGLSYPIRAMSLEYNPLYTGVVEQCIEHLRRIGEYEFNYSEGDTMTWALGDWINSGAMLEEIRSVLPGKATYGDLYARLLRH